MTEPGREPLAVLKIDRSRLLLSPADRIRIATWLMRLAAAYLKAEHDSDALLILDEP